MARDKSAADCLVLFDTSVEGRLDPGWREGVLHQRTRTTSAGPMVYVDCFPVWDTQRHTAAQAEAKKEAHRKAQEKLNRKNAKKKLVQLVNANFVKGDLIVCCEYPLDGQPQDDEQAKRDITNYVKRIVYLRRKRGLPPIKYIYITEVTVSERFGVRYHHHIIMSGGISREEAEERWLKKHGGRCNSKSAQPGEKHLSGFACYLTQDKRDRSMEKDGRNPQQKAIRRSWNSSKNLREPAQSVADKKISIRKAGRIAETMDNFDRAREIFAKLYPDCELLEVTARRSRWAAGVYIYAELRKKGAKEHGDTGASGPDMPERKRGAAGAVSLGSAAGGKIPGIAADVPHSERRKTRKGGSNPV